MSTSVTHHEHHHHHYHHHYQVPQQQGQAQRQRQGPVPQVNAGQSQLRGPRPQQHFQTNVRSDGAGLAYWGNFGADWGYATGSGTGYYGGRRFGGGPRSWQSAQQRGQSTGPHQGWSQATGQGQGMPARRAQSQPGARQSFGDRPATNGYPFFGGYGQGYGNYGGNLGGTRGYAGFGHNY